MTTTAYKGPVTVGIEWISPLTAQEIISHNNRNRTLREQRVSRIASDIINDAYDLNGESIKLSDDGTVLDGQHRLWGVIYADKGIWSVVVRGLPKEAQNTVDRVQPRNLADALRIAGELNSNVVAGIINNALVLMGPTPGDPAKFWPTMHQGLEYLAAHPEIRQAVSPAENLARVTRTPTVSAGAMYHIFAAIDNDDADDFFAKLTSGLDLSADSPIWKLREFMLREITAQRRVNRTRLHAYWIKCWNAYRKGQPMQQLRWSTGGSHPEAFPKPE